MDTQRSQDAKTLHNIWRNDKIKSYDQQKEHKIRFPSPDGSDPLTKQIRDIHQETLKRSRVIKNSRGRLLDIQKKTKLTEADVKELGEQNELLLRELERFDRLTRNIRKLMGLELVIKNKPKNCCQKQPKNDTPVYHGMKMNHPTVFPECNTNTTTARSNSVRVVCTTRNI